jgi:hypothetical protein
MAAFLHRALQLAHIRQYALPRLAPASAYVPD